MADIRLSTLGIKVSYAIESVSGQRPVNGYTHLTMLKEIPSLNVAPNTIDATVLSDSEYIVYVQGLKDLGGALEFNANFTEEFYNQWTEAYETYLLAKKESRRMWLAIDIPDFSKAFFYPVEPAKYDFGGATVNSVLESPIHLTIVGESVVDAKPTYTTDTLYELEFTVTEDVASEQTPVAGVEIDIHNIGQTVTNANGVAVISLKNGEYFYKLAKDGYKTVYGGVIIDGSSKAVTIDDFEQS